MPRKVPSSAAPLVFQVAAVALAFAPASALVAMVTMNGEVSRIGGPVFRTPAHSIGVLCNRGLEIGFGRKGGMTIDGASQVVSGTAHVNKGSRVTVTGAGSSWRVRGDVGVGYIGGGTLDITGGARVSSTGGYIGGSSLSDGSGQVTVAGTGSEWTCDGPLAVGARGDGVLIIGPGGSVAVGGDLDVAWADSVGIVRLVGGDLDMQGHSISANSNAAFHFSSGTLKNIRTFGSRFRRFNLLQRGGTLVSTRNMTIFGDYTLGASGTLQVILSNREAVTRSDLPQYKVDGIAILTGRVQVLKASGFRLQPGERFDVLEAKSIDIRHLRVGGFGFRIVDNGRALELIAPPGRRSQGWLFLIPGGLIACVLAAWVGIALLLRGRRGRSRDIAR